MKEFREEDHPRDNKGLFVVKGGARYYKQDATYEEILGYTHTVKEKSVPKDALSQMEWAEHYNKLGAIRRGGYVDRLKNGDYMIIVNDKLLLSTKSYISPKVYLVISGDTDDINDLMEILKI